MVRLAIPLPLILLLAACSDAGGQGEPTQPRDPQVAQALDDPLMTDPDLSSRNEAASSLTVESDGSLPVLPATDAEIARARAEAALVVGGADKLVASGDTDAVSELLRPDAGPAARLAAMLPEGACRDSLASSAIWAARMPAAMPIYPRAHTRDAAGSDTAGCKVRTVAFTTPVPRDEVLAFYLARAKAIGGQGPGLARVGDDVRLRGGAGRLAYDVFARTEGDHTLVRLTTAER